MAFLNCSHFLEWGEHEEFLTGSNLFFFICTGLSLLPTISLNGLTLATIWRKDDFHSPSDIFICNLAISDLAVGVLATPLYFAWKITEASRENETVVCAVGYCATLVGTMTAGCSFLTLTAATVDRYLALRYHLHYPLKVTTFRAILVCTACWVLSTAAGLSFLGGLTVFELVILGLMAPSMMIMLFCYYKIYVIICRHQSQIQAQVVNTEQETALPNMSRFKKTVSVLVYLLIVYFALYTPYVFVAVYEKFEGYTLFYFHAWTYSIAIIYVNSALNPIIYCWRLKEFRSAMKETFYYLLCRSNSVVDLR